MAENLPYCENPFVYSRRKTRVVHVGDLALGSDYPIRVQSMTITDTRDTQATVAQIRELAEGGCEIVRVTVPSLVEAESLREIKASLQREGIKVPLVADIHFTPNAALKAVEYVEKVRINPGNYADRKRFEQREYTESEYEQELARLETHVKPLVLKVKEYGVALRIGTNHGSLSDRIMNRYGDTPEGMVESALEFVRICERFGFHAIVLSMKSSNPLVMIQAYRLLAARMAPEGMDYPFHLGVTEAGDGEDGRIKSAIGIGSLLEDGIGDTIRVSLTEDPVAEVPVAFELVRKYNARLEKRPQQGKVEGISSFQMDFQSSDREQRNPFEYRRRLTRDVAVAGVRIGAGQPVRVELAPRSGYSESGSLLEEIIRLTSPWDGEALGADILQLAIRDQSEVEPFLALKRALDLRRIYLPLAVRVFPGITSLHRILGEVNKLNLILDGQLSKGSWRDAAISAIQMAKSSQLPIQWEVGQGSIPPHLRTHPGSEAEGSASSVRTSGQATSFAMDWPRSGGIANEVCGPPHMMDLGASVSPAGRPGRSVLAPESRVLDLVRTCGELVTLCEERGFGSFLLALEWPEVIQANRLLAALLGERKVDSPLVIRYGTQARGERLLLQSSVMLGSLLCDGIGDMIQIEGDLKPTEAVRLSYNLLQAARLRISKTEFISCPSCGRTLFNLQTTTERIKSKMSHLKGVKIAIMGCIVNGPGEMADADFGYIGSGPKRVDLYVGKDRVAKNVPEEQADEKLIELIKAQGKWVEP